MKIIRVGRRSHFTIVPNETARDSRISYRALGVLTRLLSNDDGWETSVAQLAATGVEGRDAVTKAMRELKDAGYVQMLSQQNERGHWEWVYVIYDVAQGFGDNPEGGDPAEKHRSTTKPQVRPGPENPKSGSQKSGYPGSESPGSGSQSPETQHTGNPAREDRAPGSRIPIEDLSQKTNENPPPPQPAPAEVATDPVLEVEVVVEDWIDNLPEALQPRSGRQRAEMRQLLTEHFRAGWKPGLLHSKATSAPLPELVASPPAFIRQRFGSLPTTPPVTTPRHEWCGECEERTRQRETADGKPFRCPDCHPLSQREPA